MGVVCLIVMRNSINDDEFFHIDKFYHNDEIQQCYEVYQGFEYCFSFHQVVKIIIALLFPSLINLNLGVLIEKEVQRFLK